MTIVIAERCPLIVTVDRCNRKNAVEVSWVVHENGARIIGCVSETRNACKIMRK